MTFNLKNKIFFPTLLFLTFFALLKISDVLAATCGNGVCQKSLNETCLTCPQDCGVCVTPTPTPTPIPTPTPTVTEPSSTPVPTQEPTPSIQPTGEPTPYPTPKNDEEISQEEVIRPGITLFRDGITFFGDADISQGTIRKVEYSLDLSEWIGISSADGNFDESRENFSFIPSIISKPGEYTIYVRAESLSGIYTSPLDYASLKFNVAPPTVTLNEFKQNPTSNQTPEITGTAESSFAAIGSIEISLDNGKSWFNVRLIGNKFNFTTEKLEDGNYEILARAFDIAGNQSVSQVETLIIDTIPPIIGGSYYSLGPQTLKPDSRGEINLVSGVETTFFVSMKGGTVEAKVSAPEEVFNLINQEGTNLWYGVIKFANNGEKTLLVSAIDGADNKTERNLGNAIVKKRGKIIENNSEKPVVNTDIYVYTFLEKFNEWVVWEGKPFGQDNPLKTGETAEFSFMLPPGKYYLEIKSPGYKSMQSEIFELSESTIINPEITLKKKPSVSLNLPFFGKVVLTFPTFIPDTSNILSSEDSVIPETVSPLSGKTVPDFNFMDFSGNEINISKFRGKEVLLSFIAPWSPPSLEQVSILSELSETFSEDREVVAVSLQETSAYTETFMKRGKYKFTVLSDEYGNSASVYEISYLPQHFFIDKEGVIKSTFTGVIKKDEALERFNKLQ